MANETPMGGTAVPIPDHPPERIEPPARPPVHIVIADEDKLRAAGEDVADINAKIEQRREETA